VQEQSKTTDKIIVNIKNKRFFITVPSLNNQICSHYDNSIPSIARIVNFKQIIIYIE